MLGFVGFETQVTFVREMRCGITGFYLLPDLDEDWLSVMCKRWIWEKFWYKGKMIQVEALARRRWEWMQVVNWPGDWHSAIGFTPGRMMYAVKAAPCVLVEATGVVGDPDPDDWRVRGGFWGKRWVAHLDKRLP